MLKKIFIVAITIACIFFSLSILKIEKKEIITNKIPIDRVIHIGKTRWLSIKNEKPIGRVVIPKINIDQPLYQIDSPKNNVEEHVTILEGSTSPEQENSILFLAAHSGTGNIAYFEPLDQLKIEDEITLFYQDKKYTYVVKDIYEKEKDGYITGRIEKQKQLILTTCCPKKENCQLILNCIQKES